MTSRSGLPDYRELPETEGGARSGWHVFGPDDQRGLVNLQDAASVVRASSLVRTGQVFPLDAPVGHPSPALFHRSGIRHSIIDAVPDWYLDDVYDNDYPQAGSQWDSLGHIGFKRDVFYNGASAEDVRSGRRNTIEHWSRSGIVGRGVLLDLTLVAPEGYDPSSSHAFSVEDLEAARRIAGVEYRPGDILLLHTGFLADHMARPYDHRRRQADRNFTRAPGIEHTEAMAEYLWDAHVSAIVGDNPTVEVFPPDERPDAWPFGYLHYMLIGQFGMALGELWWLADLARACGRDGTYEFFVTSAPTNLAGGIGSHANALAIR